MTYAPDGDASSRARDGRQSSEALAGWVERVPARAAGGPEGVVEGVPARAAGTPEGVVEHALVRAADVPKAAVDRTRVRAADAPERSVEQALVHAARAAGGVARKLLTPGVRGAPDRLVLLPGGVVRFVECKGRGGRLSASQCREHARLRALGCEVWVVWTVEEARAACRTG